MHVVKGPSLRGYSIDARALVLLHLVLLPRRSRIMARRVAAVPDVEPAIYPERGVHDEDEQLDGEVEDVEARLAVVPGRVVEGAGALDVRPRAERRAEAQQHGREQEHTDFGAEPARAELVEGGGSRHDEGGEDERDGQEGDEGVEDLAVDLNVAIDAAGIGAEGVERLNGAGDEHDKR